MENKEKTGVGRREFIGTAAAALFAGVLIQITGCSSDDTVSVPEGGAVGSIGGNHGHSAMVTKASIDAGGTVTLDIRSSADHNHTLVLTADDMVKLKSKIHVMNETSERSEPTATDKHVHTVMFFA